MHVVQFLPPEQVNSFHPSQTLRRVEHPQELRLNFEVTYPSGIILTQAPSIVETTDTKPRRVGHAPMSVIAEGWIYEVICWSVGIAFLTAGVTGNLHSSGRGARRLIAPVRSVHARLAFLFISLCMFALFVWLTWHQVRPVK
jgi:hypothetical protein